MAFESNLTTIIGNLTDDPELRYTPSGAPVATIRIAHNHSFTKSNGEKVEETTYINANVWRDLAENVAASYSKGDRVVAIGRLKSRSYENQQGQTVWVTEIEADEVAASTRFAQVAITRNPSRNAGQPPAAPQPAMAGAPADGEDVPF